MNTKNLNKFYCEQKENISILSVYAYDATGIPSDDNGYALAVAFVYYVINSNYCDISPEQVSHNSNLPVNMQPALTNIIEEAIGKCRSDYKTLGKNMIVQFGIDALKAFILFSKAWSTRGGYSPTPDSINRISAGLLDIKDNYSVADYCTGRGGTLPALADGTENVSFYCCDISDFNLIIAAIKADILGIETTIGRKNIFDINYEDSVKYDRIFMDYIIKPKTMELTEYNYSVQYATKEIKGLKNAVSGEWFAALTTLYSLKVDGKAVILMSGGSLMADANRCMREYFIGNGYIEKIIYLPTKLYEDTMVAKHIIVISHNNTSVRLVNAQNMGDSERRRNVITNNNIDEILHLCNMNGESAEIRDIPCATFAENNYSFNDMTYFSDNNVLEISDGKPLFKLLESPITRGAMIKSAALDNISTNEKTDCEYIMLSDIQDNILETGKHYITDIENKLKKYIAHEGDVIISKIGNPLKCAIVIPEPGQTMLASSNMFVINLDKDKIDPFYLMAFLESNNGKKQLASICMGVSVSSVSLEGLKNMVIPCPPLNEQKEIAEKYKQAINKVTTLRKKMKAALKDIENVFEK